jgi:CheY-like chemotaxis protein
MGGDVTFESALGRGSTFTIRVPDKRADGPHPVARPSLAARALGRRPVLVIDDDPASRELVAWLLAKEGHATAVAENGPVGLRLARELRPGAIILDVLMPGMDGWAVLRALKADPDLATIPVVMSSVLESQAVGFSLGASEFLTKPVDRDRLVAVLGKYRCERSSCSILVVEDEVHLRTNVRRTLERDGWTVAEAANGREALSSIGVRLPDLVVLDLAMPEMDGFEFLVEFRKNPAWRGIPVIVATARDLTMEDRVRLHGHVSRILEKGGFEVPGLVSEVGRLVPTVPPSG